MVANIQYTSPVQFRIGQTAPNLRELRDTQLAMSDVYIVIQQLIQTVLPGGQGGDIISFNATENIVLGAAVNLYNNAGVIAARNADSSVSTKMCHGFAPLPIAINTFGGINLGGQLILGMSGLTVGANYWLAPSSGGIQTIPDTAAGHIEQFVGIALDATSLYIKPTSWIQH